MRAALTLGVALAVFAFATPAAATVITVNTTAQGVNSGDGHCSLLEAGFAADTNTASGAGAGECPAGESGARDTIQIPAGTYALGAGYDPELTLDANHGPVTIAGAGASATTIAMAQGVEGLILSMSGSGHVVQDVTITGGRRGISPMGLSADKRGGAVMTTGTNTITRCVFNDNTAGRGGFGDPGSEGGAIYNSGTLTVSDSTFTGNHGGLGSGGSGSVAGAASAGNDGGPATAGAGAAGGSGGAIANFGTLVVERSLFSGNVAGSGGAGGAGTGGAGGDGANSGAKGFKGGTGTGGQGGPGGLGGAIYDATGHLTVTGSTFSSNAGGPGGAGGTGTGGLGGDGLGGIFGGVGGDGGAGQGGAGGLGGAGGAIETTDTPQGGAVPLITTSLFKGNSAGVGGDGGTGQGGNGGVAGAGSSPVNGGPGGAGTGGTGGSGGITGGIAASGQNSGGGGVNASTTMRNVTVSGNSGGTGGHGGVGSGGTGGAGTGGGATGSGGSATGGGGGNGGSVGGVSYDGLTGRHLTVALNSSGSGGAGGSPGGSGGSGGAIGGMASNETSNDITYSIVAQNTPVDCAHVLSSVVLANIAFPGTNCGGDIADPLLQPLADNGGPTQTQAIPANSPAFDFGTNGTPGCEATDQRGMARPQGAACDAGAYEVAAPIVVAGSASSVGVSSATIAGSVNPRLRATSYHFEYGPTNTYGSSTSVQSAGSGSAVVPASADLSGLTAATTYHYRLVATSADGTTNGSDQTLTTQSAPVQDGGGGGGGSTTPTGTTTTPASTPTDTGSTTAPPTNTGTTPTSVSTTKDTTPPIVTAFSITPAKVKKTATLKFKLSEAASVVITIRHGSAKPTRLVLNGVAGANAKKLARGRRPAGRYTATLVATDAASNASAPKRITFRFA